MWSTGEGNGKPLQHSCLENPMISMKRQNDGMLHGARVRAMDLRGGAALLVAALAAQGESAISGLSHIRRGYEDPVRDLRALGAEIQWKNE